ncbi:cell division protein FtsI (penicillin-binding protein 3) [Aquimarina sp. EL_43]|uniref:penicillin-binding protein n=1 Tax=Aquimarina TaxID=290174 RepID=UPI000472E990|nr:MULTISPECIES: penicillin-binding protein [Aquimarina]MBG6131326.1 cell division protein FtsI (penicillin-binding protein 3) [Aquimarina sp. EL_35]MBG6151791.1 cell division protein FtsI (penicillin-binding protein 3) [Aquimarina sp. EL_32]MBG6169721.1 cell division protein FtsI (penicillin-binding protein 3) [Aquimarina sp. EL_43]
MAIKEKNILNRLYFIAACMFIFAIAVLAKLVNIQFVEGDMYRKKAQERVFKTFDIPANRGNLYDSKGNLLATSVPKYDIRFDALAVNDKDFRAHIKPLCEALSKEFGKPVSYYDKIIRTARANRNRYLLLRRNLGYSQYMRVKKFPLFEYGANRGGLIVEQRTVREHPIGKIAERTVGYERRDEQGYYTRVGLEGAYGPFLRGKEGKRKKQKIAKNQWKPIGDANEVEPQDGYDVVSTIDVNIQDIAHHALLAQLETFEAEHGTVVVMETKTGEIKAISNLGRTNAGKYYEKLNYAVGESHEPGSTFKLMTMVAALEDRVIDSSYVVDTENGRVKFYDRIVKDSKWGGYGKISAAKAFELSSNTAFAKMINENYKDNPRKFVDRLINMGLGETLGLAIKGEGKPKIPYPGDKDWYGTTLPWMAHGYGVAITPLQTLVFYNAIANDGEMVKPRFIKEVKTWDKTRERFDKEILNPTICSKETAKIVQEMMKNVVKRGTADNIRTNNFGIAGKTGTCWGNYGKDKEREYISSFAGYFPSDKPIYSCIVVVHKPNKKKGYYGSEVAAPVFKTIATKIYNDIPVIDEVSYAVVESKSVVNSYEKYYQNAQKYKTIMPNVTGMPAMDVISLLENMGLKVELKGSGRVKKQSIEPGTKVKINQTVRLELS